VVTNTPTPPPPSQAPWWVWAAYILIPLGGVILAYYQARVKTRSEKEQREADEEARRETREQAARERAAAIDAQIVQSLVDQGQRQDEQIKALLKAQTANSNEIAQLHEANLRLRLAEVEWNAKVDALTRKVSALQGDNTKLRRRVTTLEQKLTDAGIPFEPEEV
jgi:uncharacterized protein YpmS